MKVIAISITVTNLMRKLVAIKKVPKNQISMRVTRVLRREITKSIRNTY